MQYFLFFILYIYLLFSDSTVEVDFFFHSAKIDGIITELRVTSARYKSKTKSLSPSHSCFFYIVYLLILILYLLIIYLYINIVIIYLYFYLFT